MNDRVIDVLNVKLEDLLKRSFKELCGLPDVTSEELTVDGKKVTVSVWVDQVATGAVRVVAQGYRHYLLGVGNMTALGFTMTESGEARRLKDEETYDFR
jgi:hypothetical protein